MDAEMFQRQVEEDWIQQAKAALAPAGTESDARGACDGVKDGKYEFHTGQEVNPWAGARTYDIATDRQLEARIAEAHERRCAGCHKTAEISRVDWINLREPERTIFLTAPLDRESGGTGKCGGKGYAGADDPDYQAMRQLISEAVRKSWEAPRRDIEAVAAR